MKKYFVIFAAGIAGIMIFCNACGAVPEKTEEPTNNQIQQPSAGEAYAFLDQNLLGKEFLQWAGKGLLQRGACEYARETKGEFVPEVEEDSIFPEGLVVMLEEALYNLDYAALEQSENPFYDTARALGADEFEVRFEDMELLFPKLAAYKEQMQGEWSAYELLHELYGIPINCFHIFHFSTAEGQDNYVFEYEWGGTSGAASVLLAERVGDDFISIGEFDLQNYMTGRVIQYEGEFYFAYLQSNGTLGGVRDGIRIHRLGSEPEQENLLIRYLPETYDKKSLYYNANKKYASKQDALGNYIEGIKEEITSEDYLDRGTKPNGVAAYCMGEEESADIKADAYSTTYKMDIANCGLPVYFWKTVISDYPSISEHLKIHFYYFDEESDSVVELEQLAEDSYPQGLNLIQMWFHEIDGEVYTFRIYHLSDYNYMLNVILLEGDQVTQIRSQLLLPQRKFVLTEGEVVNAGI